MKALDFRLPNLSELQMHDFVISLNRLLYPQKLVWHDKIDFEYVKTDTEIHREKQKEYGIDSLYIFLNGIHQVLAVYQYRKLIDFNKELTNHKTPAKIADYYADRRSLKWLVIKNPIIKNFSERREKNDNPQYNRDEYLASRTGDYNKRIQRELKRLKLHAAGTLLESDDFLSIAIHMAKEIRMSSDSESMDILLANYFKGDEDISRKFKNNFEDLVDLCIAKLRLKGYGGTEHESRIELVRQATAEFISTHKGLPINEDEMPYKARTRHQFYRDKSGYVIDLSRFIVKRAKNFADSNNAINEMTKDLEFEYNELVATATKKINSLISTDQWLEVEKWVKTITNLQPLIKEVLGKSLPDKNDVGYSYVRRHYVESLVEALKNMRAKKKELYAK